MAVFARFVHLEPFLTACADCTAFMYEFSSAYTSAVMCLTQFRDPEAWSPGLQQLHVIGYLLVKLFYPGSQSMHCMQRHQLYWPGMIFDRTDWDTSL